MRVLLVEDSVALADELLATFKAAGYAVDWLADGRDALVEAEVEPYDVIVLDLGLPGKSGLEILREWRAHQLPTPVVILTARDQWSDKIDGLKAGADDYVTKPYHPEELLLRVQAVVRRSHGVVNQAQLQVAGVTLDEPRQCAVIDDKTITLTAAEFGLLRYLMLNQGKVISKRQLHDHLYDGESERDSNVIEVHVNHLRRKLGRDLIETRRGQGYCLGGTSSPVIS
jgi:two-component system OmpR family response regulator